MRTPDVYDRLDAEDDDQPSPVECKFCGKGGLAWEDTGLKWILYSIKTGEVHSCRKPIKLDLSKPFNEQGKKQ